jgi:pantothenate kinase
MTAPTLSFNEAIERAVFLLENSDQRILIGITGKPGAGKSQLSAFLMANLPKESACLVPMDGYHFSNAVLTELGRSDRKGAPDTFDAHGYAAVLRRIHISSEEIYFPIFHREIEESIAAEGVVTQETKLVITEGNYLLYDEDGWRDVAPLLTESWYVDVDDTLRLERLADRHHFYGKERQAAIDWANGSDEKNAKLVQETKFLADFLVINSIN